MALRAKKPEQMDKRFKAFFFGGPGAGKTTAALQFPAPYVIDGERGTENYAKLINASGGAVFQTTDFDEVAAEVNSLSTEKHGYRTLVIDPTTTLETDLVMRAERRFGAGDMRVWGERDRQLRRLVNSLYRLDMNVVVISHGKIEYGDNMKKLGTTFDAWKRWPFVFDLALEIKKEGAKKRTATVTKTRLDAFPDGDTFEFSYAEIARRHGGDVLEREASPVSLATADECAEIRRLVSTVKLPDGTVDKWLAKAGVEEWEDMPSETIRKCIDYVQKMLSGKKAA